MTIAPGARLGPYEIVGQIGAGGMGEVYRAHDARLGRDVAIKVLTAHLSANPEVRARFEREARTISQLNHPHICTLYDIGHQEGIDYLVMEYLEGDTLASRLEKGPLSLAETLKLGTEIADALDRAHRSGIVHRDLKPGNVMLTKSGAKLMDFGLARATHLTPAPGALTESPTASRPLTAEGTIVGTFQYMAPEQLEGKEADARTDLWALGCVLYEAATGKRAFEGKSHASLIAAIMEREPPGITALQPLTPPALEHAVKRCLAKDPGERWQNTRDVMHELHWIAATGSGTGTPAPVTARRRIRERIAWCLAILAVAGAMVALVAPRWTRRLPAPGLARFTVTATGSGTVVAEPTSAAISPDGRLLAFTVADLGGTHLLWIRPLDSPLAHPLPGTENAVLPFWSPDSRFIAFFAGGKLKKIRAGGGSPEVICDAPSGRGGTWSREGVIVFAPLPMGPLLRVPAEGGEAVEIAKPDPARRETGLRFPSFLPDGRHFLYVSLPRRQEGFDVYVGALDREEPRRIMAADSSPVYAGPGYLLFARGDRLAAQRFDAGSLRTAGEIMPFSDVVPISQAEGAQLMSISANGVLVRPATNQPDTELVWLDRAGRPLGKVPLPAGGYGSPSLSPDDRRAIVAKSNSPTSFDLWLVDLERTVATRLTFDGLVASGAGAGSGVVWSPDGSRVAYMCKRSGHYDVCQVLASGAGKPETLVQSDVIFKSPTAWSPDGKYLVFSQNDPGTDWDIWLLPLQGDRKPVRYLRTPFNENQAAISPDGRWLAYDSDETGTSEVYVRSFPEPGEKYRVSTSGAIGAQWSGDGKELIFWNLGAQNWYVGPVFSVEVQTTPTFRAGTPRLLFTPRPDLAGLVAARDLKRFLAAVPAEGGPPAGILVTLNWQAGLPQ